MSTAHFLRASWHFSPVVLVVAILVLAFYFRRSSGELRRAGYFVAGVLLAVVTLVSPLDTLANGMLFSAHMSQHLLLLLVAPALLLLGLPAKTLARFKINPVLSWLSGVAPMWFWHIPRFCDAASTVSSVHAFQTVSLLSLGLLFWWPILAPGANTRILPLFGVVYLFTACLACTALGIIFTLTPIEVCSIYRSPIDRFGFLSTLQTSWSFTPERDREIGGLIMWVPMCLIYLGAIALELGRFFNGEETPALLANSKGLP